MLATEFEKFETVIGLSYAVGFLSLSIFLLSEEIPLQVLSLIYSGFLIGMLAFRNAQFQVKRLKFSQIRNPRFIAEVIGVWIMGEYAEILSSMAYYILRDSISLSDLHIHKLFAIALVSAAAFLHWLYLYFLKNWE